VLIPKPSERIEDFLEFLAKLFGQQFEKILSQSRGASDEEIASLARLCHFSLPRMYIDYLKVFGNNDGGLQLFSDGDTSVSASVAVLTEAYQSVARRGYHLAPDKMVVFVLSGLSGARVFYYPNSSQDDQPLIAITDVEEEDEIASIVAKSFTNYIYCRAICTLKFPRGVSYLNLLNQDKNLTQSVADLAKQHGFVSYWFSDSYTACLEQDDLFFVSEQTERGTEVFFRVPDGRKRDEFATILTSKMGFQNLSQRQ
jgi:hypothetical protein